MELLRAAVVGVGLIGSLHARIYKEHPHTILVAVVDARMERAREVADQLGVKWYTDVNEMLAREHIDVVSVATPEQQRPDLALACARQGKHLLLEKPLAPNLAEADRLISRLEITGVRTMVNFILRSDPRYLKAKEAMVDGSIGEPCTISARRRGSFRAAESYGPWTDLLISTAIHDLDVMVWVNSSPVERVYAEAVVKRCAQWGHEDAVMALLRFQNGAIGALECSWVLPPTLPAPLDVSLHVVGTAGGVFIDGSNQGVVVINGERYSMPDLAHWPISLGRVGGALRANIDQFITSLRTGEPVAASLQEARYAQELVEAVKSSIRSKEPVILAAPGNRISKP